MSKNRANAESPVRYESLSRQCAFIQTYIHTYIYASHTCIQQCINQFYRTELGCSMNGGQTPPSLLLQYPHLYKNFIWSDKHPQMMLPFYLKQNNYYWETNTIYAISFLLRTIRNTSVDNSKAIWHWTWVVKLVRVMRSLHWPHFPIDKTDLNARQHPAEDTIFQTWFGPVVCDPNLSVVIRVDVCAYELFLENSISQHLRAWVGWLLCNPLGIPTCIQ